MQKGANLFSIGCHTVTVRVAINGFGRIGRNVLRAIVEYNRKDVTVVGLVLPELAGKLDSAEINQAMKHAARQDLKGILSVVKDKLVSIDFNHNPHSSNFDSTQTQVVNDRLVRILSRYDNEWGFSVRMCDTAVALGKLL